MGTDAAVLTKAAKERRLTSRRKSSKMAGLGPADRMLLLLPRTGLATHAQLEHLAKKFPIGGSEALQALLNLMQSGVVDVISWQRDCWLPETIAVVNGADGDKMELIEPVPLPPTAGSTLQATEQALELMFNQLRDSVQRATMDVIASTEPIYDVASKKPMQVCLLAQRTRLTKEIDLCFRKGESSAPQLKATEELLEQILENIRSGELEENELSTLKALQMLCSDQISMLQQMLSHKDPMKQREYWKKVDSFRYDEEKEAVVLTHGTPSVEIEIGCEYCGGEMIVRTAVTEWLLKTYIDTMYRPFQDDDCDAEEDLGKPARVLTLCGEPSCGKTETIKYIGRLLGTLPTVKRATKELPADEAYWLRALRAHSTSSGGQLAPFLLTHAHRAPIESVRTCVDVADACRVALVVTMHPGPEAAKLQAEVLSKTTIEGMDPPDMELIAPALLKAEGVKDYKTLAYALVQILRKIKAQASDQNHYDFGIMTLRQLITQIGEELREKAMLTDDDAGSLVCRRCLSPKLLTTDLPILEKILSEHFKAEQKPFIPCQAGEAGRWQQVIVNIRSITSIEPDAMVLPVTAAEEQEFMSIFSKQMEKEGHTVITLPKKLSQMTPEELLGGMPKDGEQVQDGVLVEKLRSTEGFAAETTVWMAISTGSCSDEMWEGIHPILDDSGCLNLATGEQVRWPDNVRFLFILPSATCTHRDTFGRSAVVWTDPK
eukprot:TRINITY_DN113797_c0_g1_i1.p1 TRINITY_DN113797_c0_g1~~TRINITY_DN113797_c0_g1_i1.p1  ORF type:complete len:718 (+),score=174.02 TRINITY_DN113797_c0_g1_i1:105-2258(+)